MDVINRIRSRKRNPKYIPRYVDFGNLTGKPLSKYMLQSNLRSGCSSDQLANTTN